MTTRTIADATINHSKERERERTMRTNDSNDAIINRDGDTNDGNNNPPDGAACCESVNNINDDDDDDNDNDGSD